MSEEISKKTPLPLWRRIALGLILLVIVLLAGKMLASFLVLKCLDRKVAAISESGYPVSFDQLAPLAAAASTEDATGRYASAIQNLPTGDMEGLVKLLSIYRNAIEAGALDKLPREFQPQVAAILDQHQFLLVNLDFAATLPMSAFDVKIRSGNAACKQVLSQIQKALTLVSLRTTFLLGMKDYDRCAQSIVTLLKARRVFDTYPIVLVSSVKDHFTRLACDDVRLLLSYGKPSDAALEQLTAAMTETINTTEMKKTLLAEQVYQIETSRNLFSEKLVSRLLPGVAADMPERVTMPGTTRGAARLRWLVLGYLNAMGKLIDASSRPGPELLDFVSNQEESVSGRLKPVIAPADTFVKNSIGTAALARSAVLAQQAEIYRRANGRLAVSLQELADKVTPEIMTDPCSGKTMLYASDAQSYTFYSTGPDGVDNGGAVSAQLSPTTGQIEKLPDDLGLRIIVRK